MNALPRPKPGVAHADRFRVPRQARSRATVDRIVRVTEALLETKAFDEIAVAEIVARAGSSVGAFYARFPDKAVLLDHLDELYARRIMEIGKAVAGERASPDATLVDEVSGLVEFLVRLHRLQPGLLRTLIVEARRQSEGAFRERTRRMNRTIPPAMERLLAHESEMGHPEPRRAVYLGFLLLQQQRCDPERH